MREYLRFRCSSQTQKEEQKIDGEENMDIDDKDEQQEEVDIDMKTEDLLDNEQDKEEEEEEVEPLLPEYDYSLSDEIWDKLNNIRSYVTLPIESKLDILKILFQDVMSTNIMIELTTQRIEQYPTIKQEIKLLDDEYSAMVKQEKHKLREQRNELMNKKRILNPKKSKSTTKTKSNGDKAGSSSSGSSSSRASSVSTTITTAQSSSSKSSSNSPNKENNGSKANSRSSSQGLTERNPAKIQEIQPRVSSRREAMLRKKEEKERELKQREEEYLREKDLKQKQALKRQMEKQKQALKLEIERMNNEFKNAQNLMNDRLRMKELEITYKKYDLGLKYKTYLTELGEDRFHNKYFWNNYSDGRIFVYHSNLIYHQLINVDQNKNKNKNNNDNIAEIKDCLITKAIMKMNKNEMKCYNDWEMVKEEERNEFCWSFISNTTHFYQLLNILDERGARENELLLMLNALKKDIVASMKMMGNDNYSENMMNIDETINDNDDKSSTTTEDAPLRRSTRARKSSRSTRNKSIYISNVIPPYKQFANKGFLAYKNMMKRK